MEDLLITLAYLIVLTPVNTAAAQKNQTFGLVINTFGMSVEELIATINEAVLAEAEHTPTVLLLEGVLPEPASVEVYLKLFAAMFPFEVIACKNASGAFDVVITRSTQDELGPEKTISSPDDQWIDIVGYPVAYYGDLAELRSSIPQLSLPPPGS